MALIRTIIKSRKEYKCDKCGKTITIGGPYRLVLPYRQQPKHICMQCRCRPWEFSSNDYIRRVGGIVEAWQENYKNDGEENDYEGIIESIRSDLEDILEETEDKISNMEDYNLIESNSYEILDERRDLLNEAMNELSYINLDEIMETAKEEAEDEEGSEEEVQSFIQDHYEEMVTEAIDEALGTLEY